MHLINASNVLVCRERACVCLLRQLDCNQVNSQGTPRVHPAVLHIVVYIMPASMLARSDVDFAMSASGTVLEICSHYSVVVRTLHRCSALTYACLYAVSRPVAKYVLSSDDQ